MRIDKVVDMIKLKSWQWGRSYLKELSCPFFQWETNIRVVLAVD